MRRLLALCEKAGEKGLICRRHPLQELRMRLEQSRHLSVNRSHPFKSFRHELLGSATLFHEMREESLVVVLRGRGCASAALSRRRQLELELRALSLVDPALGLGD